MIKFTLKTKRGNKYYIHEGGNIARCDGMNNANDQWKFLGLSHVAKHKIIPLCELEEFINSLELLYKNGKPKYRVRDLDHGTIREWGDGVAEIREGQW